MATLLPSGFDKSLALKLANASQLAYTQFDNPAQFKPPPGYTIAAQFKANVLGNNKLFAFLMTSATDAILAFRGTADFPDAIADIEFSQDPFPYDANAGMTHGGFTEVYQSMHDDAIKAIKSVPTGLNLYVTGHSLGGAVAVLATLDVAVNTSFSNPTMYTFAGPRVGNPDFANRFDTIVVTTKAKSWRVANMFDVVPLLPPEQIFDPLTKQTYFYQHVDNVLRIAFVKGGAILNHSLENYIEAIQKLQ